VLVTAATVSAASAQADTNLPLHHVKYTLTALKPIYAQIYYLDHEAAVWADFGHDPDSLVPNIAADLGPNKSAVDVRARSGQTREWAMVIANTLDLTCWKWKVDVAACGRPRPVAGTESVDTLLGPNAPSL
jgi:hypothetical protein